MNRNIILLAFILSGMAALMYEIVWIRPLELIFGSTVYALSTMLSAFLAGFSLGSFLYGRKADAVKSPLMMFIKIEAAIGIYGFFILLIMGTLPSVYMFLSGTPAFLPVQFALSFIVILIPATLMGALWPLAGVLYIDKKTTVHDTGFLYSSNALGASIGPLLVGFWLIPAIGVLGAAVTAAAINLIAAGVIFLAVKKGGLS